MGDDVQGRGRLSGSGSWTVIEGRILFSLLAASCFLLFLEGFRVFLATFVDSRRVVWLEQQIMS